MITAIVVTTQKIVVALGVITLFSLVVGLGFILAAVVLRKLADREYGKDKQNC